MKRYSAHEILALLMILLLGAACAQAAPSLNTSRVATATIATEPIGTLTPTPTSTAIPNHFSKEFDGLRSGVNDKLLMHAIQFPNRVRICICNVSRSP